MDGKITYHQQISYCGKSRCRKCREGKGHGPYWYAYQTVNGHTTRTYIGKRLPPDVQLENVTRETDQANGQELAAAPSAFTTLVQRALDFSGAAVRIFTLGQFRLERRSSRSTSTADASPSWQTISDGPWQQPRVRLLLAALIASPQRRLSYEQALALLWPASTAEDTPDAGALNRIVHTLRQLLGKGSERVLQGGQREMLLRSEGDWLVLADQARIWVDADAFEMLLKNVGSSLASALNEADILRQINVLGETQEDEQREGLLKQALALYTGEYLPEERVLEVVRTRRQILRRAWISLLLEFVDLSIVQGNSAGSLEVLNRLLANDPANEAAFQRLIIVLAQSKRRGEALRAYHRLADLLQREYQLTPSQETQALYEIVRQGGTLEGIIARSQTGKPRTEPIDPQSVVAPSEDVELLELDDSSLVSTYPDSRSRPEQQRSGGELVALIQGPGPTAPIQPGRTHKSRLVGRERELETLRTLLLEVEQRARGQIATARRISGLPLDTLRRSQCMLLMGDAGIGKTRLAEEMAREAQQRGWGVIWGRAYAQESGIPYRLWVEALRTILTFGSSFAPLEMGRSPNLREARESTRRMHGRADDPIFALQPLSALLPELAEMLPQADYPHAPDPWQPPVQQEQLRLWDAARTLLTSASEHTPLLIVLDDIQWADDSSHKLLGYLARHVFGYPILLLCTCRDSELQSSHPLRNLVAHMQREHTISTLNVDPLTSEQIAQLVSHLPEPIIEHIQRQAAGNPFFAEELARTPPPTLPKTISDALNQRMGRLSSSCQQLLGNAAVLGGSFEFPLIYAMETARGGYSDEDVVLTLLEEALNSGVISEVVTGARITYHFWHPLLVNHLYESVSATRRARLHQRAADVLQHMHAGREEEVAATIAHHLVRAGVEPLRIAWYASLAGDRAYGLSAYAEAERHYRLAVEYMEKEAAAAAFQPIEINRALGRPAAKNESPLDLLFLLERLAECTMICGHFKDARALYERVLARYTARADEQGGFISQRDAQMQALLWGEIGWTWRYMGDADIASECCKLGEKVLQDAHVTGGPAWARLLHQQGSLFWLEGRYEDARHITQEALSLLTLYEQQRPSNPQMSSSTAISSTMIADDNPALATTRTTRIMRTLEGDPVDFGLTRRQLGALAKAEGHHSEALQHLNAALAIFEQYDHKRRIAHVSCDLGHVYLKLAQYEMAQAAFRRALSLAERLGDDPVAAVVYSNLGEMAASSGDLEEAESWYHSALTLVERINDRQYISLWNAGLAFVLLEQDKLDEATTCIRRALSIGRTMHNNPCIGIALIALSNARIKKAQDAATFPRLRARLLANAHKDITRALALPGLEAETYTRGQLALAQVLLLRDERDEARNQLTQVIESAHRYELQLLEKRGRVLLENL